MPNKKVSVSIKERKISTENELHQSALINELDKLGLQLKTFGEPGLADLSYY
jgi:hypothetical protein